MKMNKKIICILILCNFLISNEILSENPINIDKKKYSQLFKQARSLERNNLFDEAEIIYKNILIEDPTNKTAFNKIKMILKNKNDLNSLEELVEVYQRNQKTNTMAKLDLIEIYLWTNNPKWETLSKEIINENIKSDFIIKILLNKLLESNYHDYAKEIIILKRQEKNKQAFYSYEMGNYYISRIDYENSIRQFLIHLENNPKQYNKIANKIIGLPDYIEVQNNIKEILEKFIIVIFKNAVI